MIAVFREEKDGPAGAKKASTKSGFAPILIDTPADKTKAYSQDGFVTYLIGKDGTILAEHAGTKMKRPKAGDLLAKAKEVFPAAD